MIDYPEFDRPSGRREFQPELFLYGCEKRGETIGVRRSVATFNDAPSRALPCVLQDEVLTAIELGLVHHRTIQLLRKDKAQR